MRFINSSTILLSFIWVCFAMQSMLASITTLDIALQLVAALIVTGCTISIFEEHFAVRAAARALRAAAAAADPVPSPQTNGTAQLEADTGSDAASDWSSENDDADNEEDPMPQCDIDSLYTLILNNRHQLLCTSADKQQQTFLTAPDSIIFTVSDGTNQDNRAEAWCDTPAIACDTAVSLDRRHAWSASWNYNRPVITAVFTDVNTLLVLLGKRRDLETSRYYIQELCCDSGDILQEMRLSESMSKAGAVAIAQACDLLAVQCNNCTCTLFSFCTGKKVRTLDLEAQGVLRPGVKFLCNGTRLAFVMQADNTPRVFTLFGEEVLPPQQAFESPTSASASLDVLAASGGIQGNLLWHA
jgi:hypothetical protein